MKSKTKVFMIDGTPVVVSQGNGVLDVEIRGYNGTTSFSMYEDFKTKKYPTKNINDFRKMSEFFYDLAETAQDWNALQEASG